MDDFRGKVVVVTGAAGALGTAVVNEFASRGAKLAQVDIIAIAGPHLSLVGDLTDAKAAQTIVADIARTLGRIDVLANVAGGFTMGETVYETTDAIWKFMFDLNVNTMLNMVRATVPTMLAARGGRIVNIGARAGLKGVGRMGAYCASKSVVIRLTESLADELKGSGINVNCILPSIIDTARNRQDMPDADHTRWVAPADLARAIAFLASDAAHAIHGVALPVEALS
ncbi:MAG: SDR family NAD(P)-dependent oxidoreductase [Proteobacteria bacterium]|nr:SDR family NAD(P)-dependent oxidoreductase [Pseudomonadota bacterium]